RRFALLPPVAHEFMDILATAARRVGDIRDPRLISPQRSTSSWSGRSAGPRGRAPPCGRGRGPSPAGEARAATKARGGRGRAGGGRGRPGWLVAGRASHPTAAGMGTPTEL